MKGTVYLRKWSKMPWWSHMYHMKNLSIKEDFYDEQYSQIGRLIDYCDQNFKEHELLVKASQISAIDSRASFMNDHTYKYFFIRKFFERYPSLRSFYVSHDLHQLQYKNNDIMGALSSLLSSYTQRVKNGISKEAAAEEVFSEIDARLLLTVEEEKATKKIAKEHGAISFLDFSLIDKLKESELKTQRLKRDTDFQELVDGGLFDEFENYEPNYKIVMEDYDFNAEDIDINNLDEVFNPESFEKEQKKLDEFIDRSKNLMFKYYESMLTRDRLDGMSDKDILARVSNTPTSLRNQFTPLIKLCQKNGIKLSETGDVVFTDCAREQLIERLSKKKDLVKYALMLNDMNFGYEHKEELRKRAEELNLKLNEHNEFASKELRESRKKSIEEFLEKMKLTKSEIDEVLQFVYFEKRKKTDDYLGQPILDVKMKENDFLSGKYNRIDWENDLRDSIYERNLKLEAQWLRDRALSLSSPSPDSVIVKLVDTIRRLRRVKLLFDKEALKKATQIYFEEHSDINFDLETIELEKLEDYFKIPSEVFSKTFEQENEYQKAKLAIKKKILRQNLSNSFKIKDNSDIIETEMINYNQSEDSFWDRKRFEETAERRMNGSSEGVPVSAFQMRILEATPEEIKNYKKDHPNIEDPEKDMFIQYLEQRSKIRDPKETEKTKKKAKGK